MTDPYVAPPGSEDLPENVPDGAVEPVPSTDTVTVSGDNLTVTSTEDDDTEDDT